MKDKISIVVAVYNAQETIEKCLESLLNQTYKNIEIILVNDCSKDDSLAICKKYESKFDNVFVISNESNSGVSATRNNGIEKSTGKYICFVDSDDYVESDYIEVLYDCFQKYDTVPICGFLYHDLVNKCKPKLYKWSGGDELVSLGKAFQLNEELYLTALWNKLFDNDIIKEKFVRFDESLSMGEDLKFSLEYFLEADIEFVYVTTAPLYHYIKYSDNSLMKSYGLDDINDSIRNLKLIHKISSKYSKDADIEYENSVKKLQGNYIYHILRAKGLSDKEKITKIQSFRPEFSKKDLFREKISIVKEKIYFMINK